MNIQLREMRNEEEKVYKDKENEVRLMELKIKDIKRHQQQAALFAK